MTESSSRRFSSLLEGGVSRTDDRGSAPEKPAPWSRAADAAFAEMPLSAANSPFRVTADGARHLNKTFCGTDRISNPCPSQLYGLRFDTADSGTVTEPRPQASRPLCEFMQVSTSACSAAPLIRLKLFPNPVWKENSDPKTAPATAPRSTLPLLSSEARDEGFGVL